VLIHKTKEFALEHLSYQLCGISGIPDLRVLRHRKSYFMKHPSGRRKRDVCKLSKHSGASTPLNLLNLPYLSCNYDCAANSAHVPSQATWQRVQERMLTGSKNPS